MLGSKKKVCTLFSAIFHCPLCLMSMYLVPKSRSEHVNYNRTRKKHLSAMFLKCFFASSFQTEVCVIKVYYTGCKKKKSSKEHGYLHDDALKVSDKGL